MKTGHILSVLAFLFFTAEAFAFPHKYNLRDPFSDLSRNGANCKMYSAGIHAPFGVMIGTAPDTGRIGLYFSARANLQVLKRSGQYYFKDGILNKPANWSYLGEKEYSRFEVNIGITARAYELNPNLQFFIYSGAGFANARYLYLHSMSGLQGSVPQQKWVTTKDIGGKFLNTEAGILVALNQEYYLQAGLSGITKKEERMIVLGIGIN